MKCIKWTRPADAAEGDPYSPHPQAVEVDPGVWVLPDGVRRRGRARARATDIPRRQELRGIRRGKRLVSNVPAGMRDSTIDDDGNLVEVDAAGNIVEVTPRAVDRDIG